MTIALKPLDRDILVMSRWNQANLLQGERLKPFSIPNMRGKRISIKELKDHLLTYPHIISGKIKNDRSGQFIQLKVNIPIDELMTKMQIKTISHGHRIKWVYAPQHN